MVTLATRIISGKGLALLDINSIDWKQARIISVYCTVIREASSPFKNYNWNPPQSRYATLVFLRNGYVIDEKAMEYPFQVFEFAPETSAQNLYAIECAYKGILQTFFNLGNALLLPSISVNNDIAEWVHPNLFFDEVRVVCYADTAIRVVVESLSYDLCPDQTSKEGAPPPSPPPNPVPVSPGTTLNDSDTPVSEPYQGEDDNGNTIPHPLDQVVEPPEFPQGERCSRYIVQTSCKINGSPTVQTNQRVVYGEVTFVGILSDGITIAMTCHGEAEASYQTCKSFEVDVVSTTASAGYDASTFTYTITPV